MINVNIENGGIQAQLVDPQQKQIEQKALSITERAAAVQIRDQASYDVAVELLKGIKSLRKEAEDHHRPMIDAAYRAHRAACDALKRIDEPLKQAETQVKGRIGGWEMEQERIRREEQRRREEEARRLAEEEILANAIAAEASGASPVEVAAIVEEAATAPLVAPPPPPPAYEKAAGVAVRTSYSAEVFNLMDLILHVARNPELSNLLAPNLTAIRALARAQGEQFKVPGVRLVKLANVAVRA